MRAHAIQSLMTGFSVETTSASAAKIESFSEILRPGTKVYVACLPGEDFKDILATAARLHREGLIPVPHIPARSIPDGDFLNQFLERLAREAAVDEVLCIAGSASKPAGEFSSSMEILQTGLLEKHGIHRIGVAGHPEGSPDIPESAVMDALAWKNDFAARTGSGIQIMTQFCFEAAPIIAWSKRIHAAGNRLPIRVGIPGIASIKTLLMYAKTCGVGPSSNFLLKQARNVTKLMSLSAPDQLIADLAEFRIENPMCGLVGCHMYPFGGLKKTAAWSYAVTDGDDALQTAAPWKSAKIGA